MRLIFGIVRPRTRVHSRSVARERRSGIRARAGVIVLSVAICAAVGSAPVAAAPEMHDVHYGPEAEQLLRVYPATQAGAPVCVLVHGGGWVAKSLITLTSQAIAMQAHGCAVFDIDYRLASPTVGAFPFQVQDTESAIHYAIEHATAENGDPSNIILLGTSAGGQLVAMAADRMDAAKAGTITATISLSGPMSLPKLLESARKGETSREFIGHMQEAFGCPDGLDTTCTEEPAVRLSEEFSPVLHIPSTCPGSWLMFNSTEELMPLNQFTVMKEALEAKGCSVRTRVLAGTKHAKEYWELVAAEIFAYVKAH